MNPDFAAHRSSYCFSMTQPWGHGYATEAAFALLQWGIDTLDLNRVQARLIHATRRLPASWKSSASRT